MAEADVQQQQGMSPADIAKLAIAVALVVAGIVTMIAVVYLFLTFRTGVVTGRRLSLTALLYLVFAAALALVV